MANPKICVTSIKYDSGRITTCVVSINEKNYTVKWANGKYEVVAGGEVVNCGAAAKSGTGADAKGGVPGAAPVVPRADAKGGVPGAGAKPDASVTDASGTAPVVPLAPPPPVIETKTFTTHKDLINQVMTDLKLSSASDPKPV